MKIRASPTFKKYQFKFLVSDPLEASLGPGSNTILQELSPNDSDYMFVLEELQSTIVEHKDGGVAGGLFKRFEFLLFTYSLASDVYCG